jgi:hypothetical protein
MNLFETLTNFEKRIIALEAKAGIATEPLRKKRVTPPVAKPAPVVKN